MAITDLTGYTWVGNDVLTAHNITSTIAFELNFSSYSKGETSVSIYLYNGRFNLLNYSGNTVYNAIQRWFDDNYRTIEITGGTDATNTQLISWLEANGTLTKGGGGGTMDVTYNGTKIIDSLEVTPPVSVTYNGSTIATLNAGDTKTLQCNGKVMASNVVIGEKTLQCNGKLMASDVVVEVGGVTPTSETWVINEILKYLGSDYIDSEINFVSNGNTYSHFVYFHFFGPAGEEIQLIYDYTNTYLFSSGGWTDPAYRTVTFETPPTGDLLTWLQNNAVKQ